MIDDLITWLRAVLDNIEAHAHKDIWAADQATQGNWSARYGVNLPNSWVETESTPVARLDSARHEADALIIARFKPDNVRRRALERLAEVDAKRRILALHDGDHECSTIRRGVDCEGKPYEEIDNCTWVLDGDCSTVRLLALPNADREGYREEWRP